MTGNTQSAPGLTGYHRTTPGEYISPRDRAKAAMDRAGVTDEDLRRRLWHEIETEIYSAELLEARRSQQRRK